MIDPRLDGRVVLITGANHGIGAATAKALSRQGAQVFVSSYRGPSQRTQAELEEARKAGAGGPALYEAMQQQSPEVVVGEIKAMGGLVTWHEADLANPKNIPSLFDLCEEELGPVDILVNNHTHCLYETFDPGNVTKEGFGMQLTSASIMDAHFAVNARAYALMMEEYLGRYLKRGAKWGRIINLSTDAAHAHYGAVSYAATKHAIESYSRSAAVELGKYGITINIVAPGPIQTGYIRPDEEKEIGLKTPLGRVGRPEDVAEVIVFLASEQARWLTGQLLYVGGGWRMHQ